VSCCRNNISIIEGIIEFLTGYQTTDVSHISKEISTNLVANSSVTFIIKISRICRKTSDDDLWLELKSSMFESVVVNVASCGVNVILL